MAHIVRTALLVITAVSAAKGFAADVGVGSPAPPLKVHQWIKGKPLDLKDGKLHVVEMWATW